MPHSPLVMRESKISQTLTGVADVIISSREFMVYEECESSALEVISFLASEQLRCSGINCLVMSKKNEKMGLSNSVKIDDGLPWDDNTMLRYYLADADSLKKHTLNYYVLGQIKRF